MIYIRSNDPIIYKLISTYSGEKIDETLEKNGNGDEEETNGGQSPSGSFLEGSDGANLHGVGTFFFFRHIFIFFPVTNMFS